MPVITVTQADILKTKVYDAGWYGATIAKVSDLTTAKSGTSMNLAITFALEGAAQGKEITETFNSQMWGKLAPLFFAATGKQQDPGQWDTDVLAGKKVDVQLYIDNYNGNLNNKISNYLPLGKGQQGASF